LAPNKLAMTDREDAFKGLRPLAVRSRNFLKASGASQGVVDDAEEFVRKLGGVSSAVFITLKALVH
jgi:hypothetical protein